MIIDIICTESEQEILRVLMEKWQRYDELERKMGEIIRKYGLHQNAAAAMARSIGVDRVEVRGERFTAVNNDCVEETARMETDSIDLIHTSIPFSNHYEYTPSYNDFGHNEDTRRFFEQMDYLTPNLLRILKPAGCLRAMSKTACCSATRPAWACRLWSRSMQCASGIT